jgi:HAD superfamily hydrolase (TIGR01509 family)
MNTARNIQDKEYFLFDLDGTLVDSSACHENAFIEAIEQIYPELLPFFSYEKHKGQRTDDVFRTLGIEDEQLVTRLTDAKQSFYKQKVNAGAVQLFPSALSLLKTLKVHNMRIFLVTSASKRSTEAILSHTGIQAYFETIITGNDVSLAKPAPDCYLACLANASLAKKRALAIEDATNGIESAKRAGLDFVVVNNPEFIGLDNYAGTISDLHQQFISLH